jgi:hypothetical protein
MATVGEQLGKVALYWMHIDPDPGENETLLSSTVFCGGCKDGFILAFARIGERGNRIKESQS